ncbi:hypothetical protein [Thalassobacillus sp. C254]|uniref:hypothetical protein n=1 Tax=Thalassobacillus sp. C254 TaxID=1225341 RepID=UPI0012EE46CE|nr:hypothetical protein [Thalassobacillus sp. C254]
MTEAGYLDFERVAGENRVETSVKVSHKGWPEGLEHPEKAVILEPTTRQMLCLRLVSQV